MAKEDKIPQDIDLTDLESFIQADELTELRAERDDMRDRFMRALADAENARKRGERDRREAEQYGSTRLARDLLPVYDNLRRALDAASDQALAEASALAEGVDLTLRELSTVMTRHGVKPITPAIGDMFDPQQHQAMFEAALPGTKAGQIIQVMTEGFLLHDRLLRPAQVGACSFAELRDALNGACRNRTKHFVILSHNFEMLKQKRSEPDALVVARFERLCAFLGTQRGQMEVSTMSRVPVAIAPPPYPPLAQASLSATLRRHGEQAIRRFFG